ncbi:MAG: proton-conducting transporter membrane subunit [Cyclobacteriaceae bacterium]
MLKALLSIFLISFLAPMISRYSARRHYILAGLTIFIFGYFCTFIQSVSSGRVFKDTYEWVDQLSLNLSFYLDGLSLFFILLILFFGILIILYSGNYLKNEQHIGRFYGYLIFFMGAMVGLVLSSNLISLFLFWELTSLSSYLLIGYHNKDKKSRYAARQALLVTGAGGLALLAGFILMAIAGGSYDILALIADKDLLLNHDYLQALIILILLGVFTKSAQFPFHFWLPNAMAAPTPVSAYLHSATMVKAGIYLVFRLSPIFTEVLLWKNLLVIVGATTMVIGAVQALRADDLKKILAYTTISALGIFIMLLGVGTEMAMKGAIIYLLAHALYKGGLFLGAGVLDHDCGTRKLSKLANIKKHMPMTATAFILTSASMAGVFPFLGFLGKEILYDALYHHAPYGYLTIGLLVLSSVFFVAISLRIVISSFFSTSNETSEKEIINEGSLLMTVPPLILGALSLIFGIFASELLKPLAGKTIESVLNQPLVLDLSLWHGFNVILLLSALTIALGVILYRVTVKFPRVSKKINISIEKLPERFYDKCLSALRYVSRVQTKEIQNGYLRNYISVYIVMFILLTSYYMTTSGLFQIDFIRQGFEGMLNPELVILIFISVTMMFIFFVKSRLMVVAAIGIIGYAIALSYTFFSAPDVAITQFLAETLSLILLILITPKLPGIFKNVFEVKRRYLLLSIAFGLLMCAITLVGMNIDRVSTLKSYFLEQSLPKGKGSNVVNVILVDFRALDTLGEISVLTITMIGIISLIGYKKKK